MADELNLEALRQVYERSVAQAAAKPTGRVFSWERTCHGERSFILRQIERVEKCQQYGCTKDPERGLCQLCVWLRYDLLRLQKEAGINKSGG